MTHLLKMLDLTPAEIAQILTLADQMKYERKHGLTHHHLAGKTLAMIFTKASTRTRVSFETGMFQLGGHAINLASEGSQVGRGEPIRDTARVLSRYCDGVMIRTFAQSDVEELAEYGSVPVINGLTDFAHPCQILADLQTIKERYGRFDGLKLAWIGDGNNMANSTIVGALKVGMTIYAACPEGYDPDPQILSFAAAYGTRFKLTRDPQEAAYCADAVATDVWASMGQETEQSLRAQAFEGFRVDDALMSRANKAAIVQHCLPAHRGEEITAEVFESHAAEIFDQAENRLHAQKAVMTLLMSDK